MNHEAEDQQRRKALMLQAVEEQLNSPQAPEVRMHYNRLLSLGYAESDVRELLGTALACYIWHTLQQDDYTYADYVADLARLPEFDWEEDDSVQP